MQQGLRAATLALVLGIASGAAAEGAQVSSATAEQKQGASEAFKRAKAAFNERRLDAALEGFKQSYETVASPNAHLMMAVTLIEMDRKPEAYELLQHVIRGAETAAQQDAKYENAASAAREKQTALRAEIGLVKVLGAASKAEPGATLTVNGRDISSDRWSDPIAVDPGPVSVSLTGDEIRQDSVTAGGEVTIDFTAATAGPLDDDADVEIDESDLDRMMIVYIAGGVGAAGLLSFGIFGGLALGKFGSLEDDCPNRECNKDLQSDADSGQTFQAVANISLAIGIVGVAVGAGFLTWELLDDGDDGGGDGGGDEGVEAALSFGPGSVMVTGSF
jgi:hypothetical protein